MSVQLSKEYSRRYAAGWRYASGPNSELERADEDGRTNSEAWMDGYLDRAAGRERWHIPRCPDHDNCG